MCCRIKMPENFLHKIFNNYFSILSAIGSGQQFSSGGQGTV
jgi:hypothetical protein